VRDNLPAVPAHCGLSLDQRPGFWRVVQDLVRFGSVEPRDRHPDLYALKHYKIAVKLGWAEQVAGVDYLTFRATEKGKAEFKKAFKETTMDKDTKH